MREIKVTVTGEYDVVETVQLTDEQWEDSVDPETGKLYDVDVVADALFNQSQTSRICAQCSGWGRKFSRSLSDETKIIYIENSLGQAIYDLDEVK